MKEKITNDHVYIITVNYKSTQALEELISSINTLNYDQKKLNLIIIDSSKDLKLNTSPVIPHEIITMPTNLGFANAANIGIRTAVARSKDCYIWLLNPDTTLEKDSLNFALENIDKKTMHGSVVTENGYNSDSIVWGAGGDISKGLDAKMKYSGEALCKVPTNPFTCDYIPGCAMLFHQSIPTQYGYLPEEYFLYFEETEWCLRLKEQGINFMIKPKSLLCHPSKPNKMHEEFRIYFYNRNESYFKIKNEADLTLKLKKIFKLLREVLSLCILNIKNKDTRLKKTFKAHLFAKVDALLMLFKSSCLNYNKLSQTRLEKLKS